MLPDSIAVYPKINIIPFVFCFRNFSTEILFSCLNARYFSEESIFNIISKPKPICNCSDVCRNFVGGSQLKDVPILVVSTLPLMTFYP